MTHLLEHLGPPVPLRVDHVEHVLVCGRSDQQAEFVRLQGHTAHQLIMGEHAEPAQLRVVHHTLPADRQLREVNITELGTVR